MTNIKTVWNFFNQILTIPRPSKKEEKIQQFLLDFAKNHKLSAKKDSAGNILIYKPASSNKTNSPTVVIQCHMDMVCEKNSNITHDFNTDTIKTETKGDWMHAKGTTLGADNGIGIAMQLALLSDNTLSHPAIECLFTTDEETGLYGASNLDSRLLKGTTLINLDTEEEGEFCIGCAGGIDSLAIFKKEEETTPENFFFFEVKVSGLSGGHSGEDINKGRANAIKILAEYLAILERKTQVRVAKINGGNLRNAIPREASATLAVPYKDKELVRIEINIFISEVEEKFSQTEAFFRFELDSCDAHKSVLKKSLSDNIIIVLNNSPNGPVEMNKTNTKLVETSTNLAAIHTLEDTIFIETSQRSSNETDKIKISTELSNIFLKAGAAIKKGKDYPGWNPDFQSELVKKASISYVELFNKEPIVKTIHAGLECGVIAKKYPKMEMISFGPTILNPHSPSEKVQISSVEKSWLLLVNLLNRL